MMLLIFIFFAIIVLYLYFTRNASYWKDRNVPFIKPLPFVGNFGKGFTMSQSMYEVFDELYHSSLEPYLGFFILDKPCLLIRDPELIKKVLITDFKHFEDRNGANNKKADPVGAYVLFMLKNPDWKYVRTRLSPIFSSSKVKLMSRLVAETGNDLVAYLTKTIENNPIVETRDVCHRYTVSVISSTIFGIKGDCFETEKSEILDVARKFFDWEDWWFALQMRSYFVAPKLVDWFHFKILPTKATKYLTDLFFSVMKQRVDTKTNRNDFIDLLLQLKERDPNFLKGNILIAQAINFFVAGFETTSTTMIFALYEISRNPSIYKKIDQEIEDIYEEYKTWSYEALQETHYLEQCIKETLRKYPPLPFLDRKCTADYKVPNSNLTVQKDTGVFISVYSLHHDPQFFPNPSVFDPDRFSPKSHSAVDESLCLGFGAGPRYCIGERFGMLMTKIGLACILKNFLVSFSDETPKSIQFYKNGLQLVPLNGIRLKFQPK